MAELKDLVVPALGESITEAVIAKWLVGVGDRVEADAPIVDLETDKITVQLPAPAAGALAEIRAAEGATVRVGDVVGKIELGAAASRPAQPSDGGKRAMPAKRSARRSSMPPHIADRKPDEEETQLVVMDLKPSNGAAAAPRPPERDSAGRVLPPSMRRAHRAGEIATASSPALAPAAPAPRERTPAVRAPSPVAPQTGDREDVVPMSPLRKRIAQRLVEAQQSSASLTTFNEVDMSAVMELRARHKDAFAETYGVKLGFMSFFVKASVSALQLFPGLNAEVRGDSIVYKKHYDLGIAVGTERGLVVPVLRNCDRLGFGEIEAGIIELAERARAGKLSLEDLVGGTFTITNGGIYGSMMSTPLLNYPQTGILGMHNIADRAVVADGAVVIRPMMYIALTYDHRVVDGKEAVQFLIAVKQRIEQPDRLMFGL